MKKIPTVLFICMIVLGIGSATRPVAAQTPNPGEVIQSVYADIAAKDIDAAMAQVADDMVLTLIPPPPGMDGVFVGKEAVREWWAGLADVNGRAEFSNVTVSGNTATWQAQWFDDDFDAMGIGPAEFEGVNVVQNGQLKAATWVFTEGFLTRLEAVMQLAANQQLATRYMKELWIQGNVDLIDELIHEDFVSYAFPAGGRQALSEAISGFHAENPGGSFEVDETIVTEDHIIMRGGTIMTEDGAEEPQRVDTWLLTMRVKDGKIADRWIGFVPAIGDENVVTESGEIVGVWHVLGVDFDFYHKFYADGTFHAAGSPAALDDEPLAVGDYWIDDGQFFMKELEVFDLPPCGEKPAIYDAQLLANGNLKLTVVEDDCEPRMNATAQEHAPVPTRQ